MTTLLEKVREAHPEGGNFTPVFVLPDFLQFDWQEFSTFRITVVVDKEGLVTEITEDGDDAPLSILPFESVDEYCASVRDLFA